MILNYELKKKDIAALGLEPGEDKIYCVPFDIGEDGSIIDDAWFVVTDRRVIVLRAGQAVKTYTLAELDDVTAEPDMACGVLMYTSEGEKHLIIRYSAKHLSRYAYIARGIRLLREGSTERVVSTEPEKICPKCGRALPGTRECPFCARKGAGFMHELKKMLAPHWRRLIVIVILMLSATAVTLLSPMLQRFLIDDVLKNVGATMKQASYVLAGMAALNLGIIAINVTKTYLCARLGTLVSMDLRRKMYDKIQMLSLSFINDRQPGELMNRIMNDTQRISDFISNVFCNLFTVAIIFVVDIVIMLILDVRLALIGFAVAPIAFILSFSFRKYIHRIFHAQWHKQDKVHSHLQDVLSGMTVVKSYGKEEEESRSFNVAAEEYAAVQRRNEIFWAVFFPAINFVMNIGVYLVTFFGGRAVLLGFKSVGELTQFISYTGMLYSYIGWLTNLPRLLMNMITSVERIGDVMDQEPSIGDKPGVRPHAIVGDVCFEHASFGYKSYKPVLEDINLHVEPGEMIGLVGASGTGKSTLINLIMRLYEVDNGSLKIDGIDVRDIELSNYHSQIGVVLQETFLFSGTILNNIRFSKPDATLEEVITAAKMANAHDFICRTPDGYNTYVGEKGFNLSGGERQRIAIARAILNNPRLLILDEATASLDTESEYLIQKALERLTAGRTTFAIAHRLSTLKDADRLVVIDDHHIAEVGTHNELMERKGIYFGLVTAQLEMNRAAVAET